jgi:hypothetical protein
MTTEIKVRIQESLDPAIYNSKAANYLSPARRDLQAKTFKDASKKNFDEFGEKIEDKLNDNRMNE